MENAICTQRWIGRLEEVNCVLSRWPITKTTRHQLALRTDQMAIERYFYERCSMVTSRVEIPGFAPLYVVNIHASAFATDDSKHQHLIAFRKQMEALDIQNDIFVSGGDLNEIPPGSDKTDFCLEDKCEDESYHNPGDVPFHRDGNNYEPEQHWLDSIYKEFESAVPLTSYQQNQTANFTHTPIPNHTWERTLDYLLTNSRWKTEQTIVHQNFTEESDHCPVSGVLVLKKK